ncbi:MAG: right-handed parallel beta-helix repeat-containing protein, partial [Pseudomonadota bacterium]|nr:right-handed parallel beta-helix repeat-containing protein [Pseudomonadota bacterium]
AYATPSAAAAVAQAGDVIAIAAGAYHGDVATWSADSLTICGAGGRARLYADGANAQGKAIWVVGDANVTIDNVEFHDAKVADQNGAGIRIEGSSLTIKNSGFFDNEDGILGGDGATITIDRSEFARNGFGDGQTHNLYVGNANLLVVTSSWFHEAKVGHNFKSRAKETRIENSYFMDGPNGTSSYLCDFPNGGAVTLRGNTFQKGPLAENPSAISYGAEGLTWPVNTLTLVHNTLVMTRRGGNFLYLPSSAASVTLKANLFAGTDNPQFLAGGFPIGSAVQSSNVTSIAANIPGADNIALPNFWPNASLLGQIGLPGAPDPDYVRDAPRPLVLRDITGNSRVAGAIQAPP